MRGKRLYFLKLYDKAIKILDNLRKNKDINIKAESGLYLERIMKIKGEPRIRIISLLNSSFNENADPDIIQSLIFYRAKIYNRAGKSRSIKKYKKDIFYLLIKNFPGSKFYDSALISLASHYKEKGDIENALSYYEKNRNYKKSDKFIDSAYFSPAILLYRKGKSLKQSFKLFEELNKKRPLGP